ncbi:MAG: ATP-dependent Clp protease proteolytic subunit [Candidatus Hodarchaeota archaeon]
MESKEMKIEKPPVQPTQIEIKQPPILFEKTQQMIKEISKSLDGLLITYWNGPGGNVCDNDIIAIYEMLEKIGKVDKIYLFIKSYGGNVKSSLRIVNLLRQYAKEIITLIPLACVSAATMIALGADEIKMGPMAYLSAIDTSLIHDLSPINRENYRVRVSLDELKRIVKLWRDEKNNQSSNPYESLFQHIHPLVIGAVDRADSLSIMLCKEILLYHLEDKDKAENIANTLNSKYPSHSYPILLKEAEKIGLNVSPLEHNINDKLLELNEIYAEMGQKAITDYDVDRYHSNQILNIIEIADLQLFFQVDKDFVYRTQERRWIAMNDNSCWRRWESIDGEVRKTRMHIA